jgi:glutathionylspermidine synthase
MRRIESNARNGWREIVESQGLLFHSNSNGTPYWDETAYFEFSIEEIQKLEAAANELHGMFLHACRTAIMQRRLAEFGIPERLHETIRKSWRYDDWELYGRFDFTLDAQGVPKLLEYNADTPTGLLEASLIQWFWKESIHPQADQFNSLHEALVSRWEALIKKDQLRIRHRLYMTSVDGHVEDRMTVGYIGETAEQAGLATQFLPVRDIGWSKECERFVDLNDEPIRQLFKLYPWEWLSEESFGQYLKTQTWQVLEPPWKVVCASKGILLLLEELFPNHPNLLRVSCSPDRMKSYVRKPFFGREGRNIDLIVKGERFDQTSGPYENEASIYQEYCPLIRNGNNYAQLGVWMIGPEARGMGLREDVSPILRNTSRFVPHVII